MKSRKQEHGFTVIEVTVVVLLIGILAAFAAPRITNAMREYRLAMAVRQFTDLIQRAKTKAMSDNKTVTLRVDTANRKAGIVVLNSSGTELTTEYIPLPPGIIFSRPASVTAPMTGAPFSSDISFPVKSGSTTIFQQDFNSRGFPAVTTAGAINTIYLSNSRNFRALTLSSVGGISTWVWQTNQWVNTRTAKSAS
ncbi:MAG TPA: prepilin-type N-terminal cleavage/methylation domain-containing protein [Blastocatellia bacterium]|nr:prepilin-type N-terminal cleavage/methylation domain-containing protein [Blastocatellia bacterium]